MPLLPNNRPETSNIEAIRVLKILQVHSLVAQGVETVLDEEGPDKSKRPLYARCLQVSQQNKSRSNRFEKGGRQIINVTKDENMFPLY